MSVSPNPAPRAGRWSRRTWEHAVVWDTDVERRRNQWVQLQLFGFMTVACMAMSIAQAVSHHRETTFMLALAALSLAVSAVIIARLPARRPAVVMGYMTLLLLASTLSYVVAHVDLSQMMPAIWAVMAAVAITESPGRTIYIGTLCLAACAAIPVVTPTYLGYSTFELADQAAFMVVCLVMEAVLGNLIWRATTTFLLQTGHEQDRLRADLIQINAALEERVQTRSAELERQAAALSERSLLLGETLADEERMVRQLEQLSNRDELTGLDNRRRFLKQLDALVCGDAPFALLLADLDHFKQINDTYGHPTGDSVLVQVAQTLSMAVRTDDTVARIGGEEFAVLLAGVDLTAALELAEELRSCATAIVPAPGCPHITLSVGVAVFDNHHPNSASDLMVDADKALYAAKEQGRNRVVALPQRHLSQVVG